MLCLLRAYCSVQMRLWCSLHFLRNIVLLISVQICEYDKVSKPSKWIEVTVVFTFNASLKALNPSQPISFSVSKTWFYSIASRSLWIVSTYSLNKVLSLIDSFSTPHRMQWFHRFQKSYLSIWLSTSSLFLFFFSFFFSCIIYVYNLDTIPSMLCWFSMLRLMKELRQHQFCCLWLGKGTHSLGLVEFIHEFYHFWRLKSRTVREVFVSSVLLSAFIPSSPIWPPVKQTSVHHKWMDYLLCVAVELLVRRKSSIVVFVFSTWLSASIPLSLIHVAAHI